MRNMLGDRATCKTCGMDIEFRSRTGNRKVGWIDRGGNRFCDTSGAAQWDNDGNPIKLPHHLHDSQTGSRVTSTHTWADGFGVWHATVAGRGPNSVVRAKDAIWRELLVRSNLYVSPPPRPRLVFVQLHDGNRSEWKEA